MLKVNTYFKNTYLVRTEERFYDVMYLYEGVWNGEIGGWIVHKNNIKEVIEAINQKIEEEKDLTIINNVLILFFCGIIAFLFLNL